jgi:TRAP transporter TAXI family solute receptor
MPADTLARSLRRAILRWTVVVVVVLGIVVWVSARFTHPIPPARIVLASGAPHSLYVDFAQRYKAILARHGVKVEERRTDGAAENLQLLIDRNSGVDVAFMQGGVATQPEAAGIVMLASLYYEPLWIFYRAPAPLTHLKELRGKRIAVGLPQSGTRAMVEALLAASGVNASNTALPAIGGAAALAALRAGTVDAATYVDGALTPTILEALRDPSLRLMSLDDADAYQRLLPYITTLRLPRGTIDLEATIPPHDVMLIGTKAMLAAHDDFHPALANLLQDAARELHAQQGDFEAAGEFPGIVQVDLPVSAEAQEHARFGSTFLHRYLPFWAATIAERIMIVGLPLLVILVPVLRFLPPLLRWRVRSRFYAWYAQLADLERGIARRAGTAPEGGWSKDLDRIDDEIARVRVPPSLVAEAYTLRTHVEMVRRRLDTSPPPPAAG